LGEINNNVEIDFDLEKCAWKGYNKEKVIKILESYGFKTLIKRLFGEEAIPESIKKPEERKTLSLL